MEIKWEYFFGGSSGRTYDRYYKSFIKGVRIEKHISNKGTRYAIGNIDEALITYDSESELMKQIEDLFVLKR